MHSLITKEEPIFKINTIESIQINCKELYEKHIKLFKELDYQLERYKVNYSVAVVKMSKEAQKFSIDIESLIRLTDKYLPINEDYFCIIFTHSNLNQAYQALLVLEKSIIRLTDLEKPIRCALVEKDSLSMSESKILEACKLINQDEAK